MGWQCDPRGRIAGLCGPLDADGCRRWVLLDRQGGPAGEKNSHEDNSVDAKSERQSDASGSVFFLSKRALLSKTW